MDRRLFIVIAVVGFHVLGLWALQTGLLRRAVELVVPVQVMAEFIELPQPQVTPPPPPPPQPRPTAVPKKVTPPAPKPAPQPVAMADPTPSPTAATGINEPQPPVPPQSATVAAAPSPPAPPKNEPASSDAAHLNNPKAPYPKLSIRLNEQGSVLLRILVEADGKPSQVVVARSSGYDRLDQSALETVRRLWRFVPRKENGIPVPSWINTTIRFELNI